MTYNVDMYFLSSLAVKFLSWFIKTFKLGNGYTWPGHFVLKISPNVWESSKLHFSKGVILISGTNGKTTTAKLLAHLLFSAGYSVTTNASGANLTNGILTSIFLNTNLWGKVTDDFAVLEVDEFNLPDILSYMKPSYLILTNLSRDQLDRYGEVDIILTRWHDGLSFLDPVADFKLVLGKDIQTFDSLKTLLSEENVLLFDSSVDNLERTSLVGSFNAKNVNSAVLVTKELGLSSSQIEQGLHNFEPAFGRGEVVSRFGKTFYIFLAKNPASFNNNLSLLKSDCLNFDSILFLLNDKIPDGRDVSWIYDIEPNSLSDVCANKKVYIGGTRSLDMNVRLNYAQVANIVDDFGSQFSRKALSEMQDNTIVVLPNYSAMLAFRKILTGRNIL